MSYEPDLSLSETPASTQRKTHRGFKPVFSEKNLEVLNIPSSFSDLDKEITQNLLNSMKGTQTDRLSRHSTKLDLPTLFADAVKLGPSRALTPTILQRKPNRPTHKPTKSLRKDSNQIEPGDYAKFSAFLENPWVENAISKKRIEDHEWNERKDAGDYIRRLAGRMNQREEFFGSMELAENKKGNKTPRPVRPLSTKSWVRLPEDEVEYLSLRNRLAKDKQSEPLKSMGPSLYISEFNSKSGQPYQQEVSVLDGRDEELANNKKHDDRVDNMLYSKSLEPKKVAKSIQEHLQIIEEVRREKVLAKRRAMKSLLNYLKRAERLNLRKEEVFFALIDSLF